MKIWTEIRWPQLLAGVLIGTFGGLGMAGTRHANFESSVVFHLPRADKEIFSKILLAINDKVGTEQPLSLSSVAEHASERGELAREILRSRSAAMTVTQDCGLNLSPEQIERFRAADLSVEVREETTVELSVRAPTSERARSLCQGYLDYYAQFVKNHPMSQAGTVRQSLERRYVMMAGQVRRLEKKLNKRHREEIRKRVESDVEAAELRELLATKHSEEDRLGADVLQRLRTVRLELESSTQSNLTGDDGLATKRDDISSVLDDGRTSQERYSDTEIPQPSDLHLRIQLERNYEDTMALHRVMLLQHSVLRTMEELDGMNFKVIDGLTVHRVQDPFIWIKFGLGGALAGLACGLIASSPKHRGSELLTT